MTRRDGLLVGLLLLLGLTSGYSQSQPDWTPLLVSDPDNPISGEYWSPESFHTYLYDSSTGSLVDVGEDALSIALSSHECSKADPDGECVQTKNQPGIGNCIWTRNPWWDPISAAGVQPGTADNRLYYSETDLLKGACAGVRAYKNGNDGLWLRWDFVYRTAIRVALESTDSQSGFPGQWDNVICARWYYGTKEVDGGDNPGKQPYCKSTALACKVNLSKAIQVSVLDKVLLVNCVWGASLPVSVNGLATAAGYTIQNPSVDPGCTTCVSGFRLNATLRSDVAKSPYDALLLLCENCFIP